MKLIRLVFTILFGALLIIAGINHFISPEFYDKLIPDYLPKLPVNYSVGILEIILGIGVLIPRYRSYFAFGIVILMCLFLPVHIWDITRDNPAVGSHNAAMVRLSFQFVLIYWAWFISRK